MFQAFQLSNCVKFTYQWRFCSLLITEPQSCEPISSINVKILKLIYITNALESKISKYSWIHFEGRPNTEEIEKMMNLVRNCSNGPIRPKISLEMEKIGRNYDALIPLADVIFVSKEQAISRGFQNMSELVKDFYPEIQIMVICPWGEKGAAGRDFDGKVFEIPAFMPKGGVIDTVGAGDTFNATVVTGLSQGKSLKEALEKGCKVAGTKCGQYGYKGLKEAFMA